VTRVREPAVARRAGAGPVACAAFALAAAFAEPAVAQPVAQPVVQPATAAPAASAAASPLGRLFFTPDERRRIDAGAPDVPASRRDAGSGSRGGDPGPSPASPLRVDGVVRRADGGTAVWVDGRPLEAHAGRDGLQVGVGRDPSRVRVRRPGGAPTELRAGESEDRPGLGPGNRVEVTR